MANTRSRKAPATPAPAEEQVPATITLPAVEGLAALDFEALRKDALAASESADTARDYASARFAEYVTASAVESAAGTRKSVLASLATYAAYKAGVLFEGKKPKDAAEGTMDFEEWGEFFAESTGGSATSAASVRTWLRAGQAMVEWNLDPDSRAAYALLGGLAQRSQWNKARHALVEKQAEEGEDFVPPTAEEIEEIVTGVKAEVDGLPKTTRKAPAQPEDGDPKSPLDRVKAALAGLSKEDAHAVLAEAAAWLDSEEAAA